MSLLIEFLSLSIPVSDSTFVNVFCNMFKKTSVTVPAGSFDFNTLFINFYQHVYVYNRNWVRLYSKLRLVETPIHGPLIEMPLSIDLY